MAKYWTYLELKTKIQQDVDLEAEDFIQESELMALVNEAIDKVEQHINTLGLEDDYFLDYTDLSLVAGTSVYNVPSTLYAHKLRGVIYSYNDLVYPITRFRGRDALSKLAVAQAAGTSTDYYKYQMFNKGGDTTYSPQLLIVPTPQASEANAVRLWFIRDAARMTADTSVCDIPIAAMFIIKYVRFMAYFKEGHPNYEPAKAEMELEKKELFEALATMVPDHDSTIEPDLSMYEEMS
jgi:hypothetical protein